MRLISRVASFFSTILIITVFEVWALKPAWVLYCGVAVLVLYIFSIWLATERAFWHKQYWDFFINPFTFLLAVFAFFSLIDNELIRQLYLAAIGTVYFLVLQNIFSFLHQTRNYQPYALENMYSYLSVISLFLFSSSVFGFFILFGWQNWIAIVPMVILGSFLFYRTIVAHKIPWRENWSSIAIIGLIVGEAYYCLSWLPTSFLFDALILTIVYYFLSNVMRDYLEQSFTIKSVRKYLYISLIITLASFLTARWF